MNSFFDLVYDYSIRETDLYVQELKSYAQSLDYESIFTLGYGSAFAYNTNLNAPYFELPYDEDLEIKPEIWEAWYSGFGGIEDEAEAFRDNWLSLKAIKVDYGRDDAYEWIPEGCRYFDEVMNNAGIPVEVEAYDGGHGNMLPMRVKNELLPYFDGVFFAE